VEILTPLIDRLVEVRAGRRICIPCLLHFDDRVQSLPDLGISHPLRFHWKLLSGILDLLGDTLHWVHRHADCPDASRGAPEPIRLWIRE
jgi:hypothetical protein